MGVDCGETDHCASKPCLNNGTCTNNSNSTEGGLGFVCDCLEGWEGERCEECVRKNCKTCDGTPAMCSECDEAYLLEDGVCGECLHLILILCSHFYHHR